MSKYYSVEDQQTGRVMRTGMNSNTKKDVIEAMKARLMIDYTKKELAAVNESYLNAVGFVVFTHDEELEGE